LTSEIQAFVDKPAQASTLSPVHAWSQGRLPGTTCLAFGEDKVVAEIHIPERLTQMTMAAWITVEVINDQPGFGTLAASKFSNISDGAIGKLQWQIDRTGEIEFAAANGKLKTPSVMPWQTWRRNQWRHVAIVADPQAGSIRAYLDGKRIAEDALPKDFAVVLGDLILGGQPLAFDQFEHGFSGRISEFVVLSRIAGDREVAEWYESGKR
jgi:hypothetical protein